MATILNKGTSRCATLSLPNKNRYQKKIAQPTLDDGTKAAKEVNFRYTTIIQPNKEKY